MFQTEDFGLQWTVMFRTEDYGGLYLMLADRNDPDGGLWWTNVPNGGLGWTLMFRTEDFGGL